MYLKAKNIYYKLNDSLSLKLENLVATLETSVKYTPIELNNNENYSMHINYANLFIHKHQFILTAQEIITSIFKEHASNIKVHFEPRDILKIDLLMGKMFPVNIEGKIEINSKNNAIRYKFENIKVMKFPANSLLDAIKVLPGISLSFESPDGKAKFENDYAEIYAKEFIPDIKLEFELSDIYFTEKGLNVELTGKKISEIQNEFTFELPESYAYLLGDSIKINNIEISDTKIALFRDDGVPFAINLATYMDFVRRSFIKYSDKDEIIVQVSDEDKSINEDNEQ